MKDGAIACIFSFFGPDLRLEMLNTVSGRCYESEGHQIDLATGGLDSRVCGTAGPAAGTT